MYTIEYSARNKYSFCYFYITKLIGFNNASIQETLSFLREEAKEIYKKEYLLSSVEEQGDEGWIESFKVSQYGTKIY